MKIPHKSAFESQTFATDRLIPDYGNRSHFNGIFDNAVKFICDAQLRDRSLYRRFAAVFGTEADDSNRGWRCEYWGKLMRGACFICAYTQDSELYSILEEGVRELLAHTAASANFPAGICGGASMCCSVFSISAKYAAMRRSSPISARLCAATPIT